jgi:AraC-like DNA-binding protein
MDGFDYLSVARDGWRPHSLCVRHNGSDYFFRVIHISLPDRKQHGDPAHPCKEHRHDVYHIALYLNGPGRFLLNEMPTACRRGSLVLCSPEEPHFFGPLDAGELEFAELTFVMENSAGNPLRLDFKKLLSLLFGGTLPNVEFPVELDACRRTQLLGLMQTLLKSLLKKNEQGAVAICASVLRTLLFLVDNAYLAASGDSMPPSTADMRLLKVKDYIEHGFREKLRLSTLSEKCGMAPGYFCRRFKEAFGVSPIELAMRSRIEAAKGLLFATDMSCKEIAERTGFSTTVFFSRVFRERCGFSPRNWKKMGIVRQRSEVHGEKRNVGG